MDGGLPDVVRCIKEKDIFSIFSIVASVTHPIGFQKTLRKNSILFEQMGQPGTINRSGEHSVASGSRQWFRSVLKPNFQIPETGRPSPGNHLKPKYPLFGIVCRRKVNVRSHRRKFIRHLKCTQRVEGYSSIHRYKHSNFLLKTAPVLLYINSGLQIVKGTKIT